MEKSFLKLCMMSGLFLLICAIVMAAWVGCANLEQKKDNTRVRHYFSLKAGEPITAIVIESNLVSRFPIGTPILDLETWLAGQGLGTDGNSTTWHTNQFVSYRVNDYSESLFSMLHIQVTATLDRHRQIQAIHAEVYSYSL